MVEIVLHNITHTALLILRLEQHKNSFYRLCLITLPYKHLCHFVLASPMYKAGSFPLYVYAYIIQIVSSVWCQGYTRIKKINMATNSHMIHRGSAENLTPPPLRTHFRLRGWGGGLQETHFKSLYAPDMYPYRYIHRFWKQFLLYVLY